MSATKDTQEVPKKPSSEAKRIIQNDQEKQRKEKIKTCIGEIAKELPPSADHVDRKPSTLSIVSQAKDYIKSLKEKNQAYEKNFSVAEQEELKRLREIHAAQQEKIKQLEETVKAYALDKVIKNKSLDETNPTASSEGRQGRPKTIKLLEKERHEQIQPANTEFNTLDPALPLVGSTYSHHGSGGGNNSNNLPPTSIVLPAASSGISIMTVAPTILSVKSPSLGQTRNQQTNRSISTSSVAGSTASSRVNPTSSTLVSYMDLIGNDYGSGNARVDSGQSNLVYSTSSMSLTSPSILSTSSGNIISTADLMGLQQQHQNTGNVNGNTAGATGLVGNMQSADYSLLHHQQQGIMNLHQDGSCSTSALQTLASVATSSHMAGLTMSNNQGVGATSSMLGLPVGVPSMSLGHLHQQQGSILTDTGAASTQACKQVYINGQVLTLSDQGLSCGPHGESDCQSNIQASSLCQQLPLAAGTNFQQHQHSGITTAGLLNQGNFSHATSINTNQMTANNANQSVIYTINEQGQLVPLQSSFNQIQPATGTGLDFVSVSTAGGNIISGFQNTSAGSGTLMQSSLQHQTQPNFLTQAPIVSLAGQGSNQQFTILQAGHGNHLSNQIIPSAPLFMTQQNQVLNLAGLSGLQMVNPFSNMMVNNMTNTLNGATVKLVGNELKIVQPGDSSAAQGPTHVMVDGSLIPISTNPQTIMPTATAPMNTIAQKQQQQLSLGGNSILQFDPNNPSAPPILISGPVTTFQMAPQILGAGALHSPALSNQHGILQMASAGTNVTMGSSTPFQLGGAGGLAVASSMVASTVTTNSVTACISSPSVSAATKGPKGLPPLAPALSQASPTIGSTVAINSGYQTMLTTGMPQQFILNGQKIVTSKMATSSLATQGSKSAQNRKRSPSASRVSPIAAVDIAQHFTQQQQMASTASAMVAPMQTVKSSSVDKSCKTKSSKVSRQQAQQPEEKAVNQLMKTDLLAQATATAGILMDSEAGAGDYAVNSSGANESNLNISAGSNMNLSSSSAELQINLKHSPRDEEDDNVQLIIDENCMSGMSSTSPAHSSFSPNMSLGSALSVNTSSSVFTHDLGLGGSQHQSVHLHPSNGDLTTPLVSPNITSSTTMSKQHKQITSSPITGLPTIQQLSPLSFTPVTSSASISNPSTTSEMHIMGGSFRPEDVFARFAAENKLKLSPDKLSPYSTSGSGTLSANTVFDVASSLSLPISSTSISATSAIKSYVPIAPAPAKASAAVPFAQDSTQTLTFMEAMSQASLGSDKPAGKSKSRSRKTSTPILPPAPVPQIITIEPDVPTIQQNDGKKKAANKKRKTKAELRQEKEERERVAREEFAERKLREAEVFDKTCVTAVSKQVNSIDEDSLIPVLNENDAVKEQILHSVSESKLLNTDGSQISLMDMVDKIEIFNSAVSDAEDGFPLGGQSNLIDTVVCNTLGKEDAGGDKPDSKSVKCDATKKRKGDIQPIPMAPPGQKADNKRPKKPTKVEATKPMGNSDVLMFGLVNSGPPSVSSASSDIYAFVDEEDNGLSLSFLQQPPTPSAKSPTKKNTNRKSKSTKSAVPETQIKPETKTVNSLPGAIGNNIIMTRSETKNTNKSGNSHQPQQLSAVTSKSSGENSLATSTVIPTMAGASSVSSPSSLMMPKSPPSFSALQSKTQATMSAPLTVVTTSNSSPIAKPIMTSTSSTPTNNSSTFMPKKVTQNSENSVHASLEESLMDFSVMDFQSSPKLSEAHDDHDNSIGLPAETIADFFNQHSPGKMMLNTSPTNLQNGVLSPSDVDLPALRTPATPMNHNHTDPVLMLDTQDNKEMVSRSPSTKQPQSRMHTPPPMDPKSPANSLSGNMSIASSTPVPSLSLTQSSSSPLPPPVMSSTNMTSSSQSSCMNSSSSNALHHLDPTSNASTRPESPMPSLSSSSLDALSEIIPLKPITSELESEENESCAQKQRRPTPVQTQPLSHVPLSSDIGMVMSSMPELQQKSQPQRPNPPHLPPQSSPHNLRPPSASTTPLPSPKLHTSPGSASSVHSMSPAAQHGHSCQKQQGSQMGANPHMERVSVPPLSHPPQQAQSLSQLFPDTSPCSANFASPPSGSSMKLKHMSPSSAQEQQNTNFMNSQKSNSFPQNSNQQQKNQYSVDKIIEHPNSNSAPSSRLAESFNFTNMGSNVTTASSILPTGSMPLTSPNSNGFSFSLSPSSSQASSCSGNLNASNSSNNTNRGSLSSMQSSIPSSGGHMSHNTSYLSPFFPPPTPMSIPASSSSSSSTHHSLAMHPLGNMEIQHTNTSRPSSGGSAATAYGMGPSSLMTYGNQPKLDIPPIVKSPTYNHSTPPTSSSGSNSNKSSNNVGSGGTSYGSNSKQAMDSSTSSNRYPGSKSTPESIYQQQQKRPNTIQHPPSSHMDPMSHLSSSAHNNSFFPMAFPTAASASMPLRHLPDTRDMPSRSPYDYPSVPHHPAMGFPHPHSQITSGYGAHASFTRDCARLETTSHHQTQQQQAQQPQQQPSQQQQQTQQQQNQQQQTQQQQNQQQSQQSPRKQSVPKKSSSSASVGGTTSSSSTNSSSSSNNSSNRNTNSGTTGSTINQGHSPASSTSSRAQPSQHHSNHQQTSASTSNNSSSSSSSHNRSGNSHNSQKRKSTSSSSSSSKKKNTASQHTGFPADAMDASMSQNMFEFNYLNFPTLTQSMSPPAARPHQTDTPFLSGMFNAPPRPISNSGTKTADMAASHFPLSHTRAQNSFFQPGSFGMNFMTGNHSNAAAGISPHSMGVPPHMSFGLFGNETASATDNITSNKFLHSNPILPGAPHQSMDHSLQHGAHQTSLYHSRPHSAQSHVMAAFYPHSFDSRGHMGQPFNSSMGPPTFHTPGLPPINFSMHDAH